MQLIWQHPQEAVNPRRRMKTVLEEGGVLDERLIRGTWDREGMAGAVSGGIIRRRAAEILHCKGFR